MKGEKTMFVMKVHAQIKNKTGTPAPGPGGTPGGDPTMGGGL